MKPSVHPTAAFVVSHAIRLVETGAHATLEDAVEDVLGELASLSAMFESDEDDMEQEGTLQ